MEKLYHSPKGSASRSFSRIPALVSTQMCSSLTKCITHFWYTFISNHHIREQNDLGRQILFVKMGDVYECSIAMILRWVNGWGESTDCISNSHAKDC